MKAFACCISLCLLSPVSVCAQTPAAPKLACADLARLALPNVKIGSAEEVKTGTLTAPPSWGVSPDDAKFYKQLPDFCRVTADLSPSKDSDIKMELWVPVSGWNGKFRGQGNGGFAGAIDYSDLALAVSEGFASAGTDTGHAASFIDASWALGHPEKIIDYGYRGIHEMTVQSKAILQAYYGLAPAHSYFASCSDGGREALMEAQRFPEDYDGILAGAPANNWTRMLTTAVFNSQALTQSPGSYVPASKLPAISAAVLAACDKADGVADGIVSDPLNCHFDPGVMLCKSTETDQCLTAPQVTAMKALYAGTHDASGKLIYPGYVPGAELGQNGWSTWILGPAPNQSLMYLFGFNYFSNMVYSDPKWDFKSFKVDAGLKAALDKTGVALDATDPNLKPFLQRGGKLILFHGWNDPAITALNTIDYYKSVEKAVGSQDVQSSIRLYLAPGVQHCGGGTGPDEFGQNAWIPGSGLTDPQHNVFSALEVWVENHTAPDAIIASKMKDDGAGHQIKMSRPLCPFPQSARYKGSGDANDAANFSCSAK